MAKALHDVLQVRFADQRLRNRLDRDRARNRLIETPVDAAHATFTEDVLDIVFADFLRNRHCVCQAASAASAGGLRGSHTVKRVPRPTVESTSMRPPCCCTILYEIDRPSPVPLPISLVEKNGSKILGSTSGAMPPPLSATSTATPSPSLQVVSVIEPGRSPMACAALEIRFRNPWLICAGEPPMGAIWPNALSPARDF